MNQDFAFAQELVGFNGSFFPGFEVVTAFSIFLSKVRRRVLTDFQRFDTVQKCLLFNCAEADDDDDRSLRSLKVVDLVDQGVRVYFHKIIYLREFVEVYDTEFRESVQVTTERLFRIRSNLYMVLSQMRSGNARFETLSQIEESAERLWIVFTAFYEVFELQEYTPLRVYRHMSRDHGEDTFYGELPRLRSEHIVKMNLCYIIPEYRPHMSTLLRVETTSDVEDSEDDYDYSNFFENERSEISLTDKQLLELTLLTCGKDPRAADVEVCAICITDTKIAEVLALLPCEHAFHKVCIFTWLRKNGVCPLCRDEVWLHFS